MPARYVIDEANRLVRTIFSGTITYLDSSENLRNLRSNRAFDPKFSELIEFEEGAVVQWNCIDILSLLESDTFSKTSKRAIVAGSRPSIYGTARMFQLLMDDHCCIRIFERSDDAVSWLVASECEANFCPKVRPE